MEKQQMPPVMAILLEKLGSEVHRLDVSAATLQSKVRVFKTFEPEVQEIGAVKDDGVLAVIENHIHNLHALNNVIENNLKRLSELV